MRHYFLFILCIFFIPPVALSKSTYPHHLKVKSKQTDQELQEMLNEMDQKNKKSQSSRETLSLNLKPIDSSENKIQKPVRGSIRNENSRAQIGSSKDKDLAPLIQEAFFSKSRVERDLSVYLENQEDLDFDDESITMDLEGVEVRLKNSKGSD